MIRLTSLTCALVLLSSSAFAAEQPSSVVELFTSQGCSSCPPVNNFVNELASDDDKLILTYGVTYWDYLGWKDTFGDPKFTQRQKYYGKALQSANIYTPQIVLNGSTHSPRYTREDVEEMVMPDTQPSASLYLEEGALMLASEAPADSKVFLVSYTPGEQTVPVKRGENNGRTLALSNVVTDVMPVDWNGSTVSMGVTPEDGAAYAVLIHDAETAEIVSAATYAP